MVNSMPTIRLVRLAAGLVHMKAMILQYDITLRNFFGGLNVGGLLSKLLIPAKINLRPYSIQCKLESMQLF